MADANVHARAKEWSEAFPAVFAGSTGVPTRSSPSLTIPEAGLGFDCVIGNPPWERLKLQEREFFALSAMDKKALCALYDFENKRGVFADVHRAFKFSVLLMNGNARQTEAADFVFFAQAIEDLDEPDRQITLSARDLKILNPNTRTCPIFRSRFDCELTKRIYRNVPILIDQNRKSGGNPWELKFFRMFDQTNDAELFRDAKSLKSEGFHLESNRWIRRNEVYLPIYEAKMVQAYDHRAASVIVAGGNWMRQGQTEDTTLVMHQNPEFVAMPRFWVPEVEVLARRGGERKEAFLAMKDVTSPTNQRTMIASLIPWSGVVNSAPLMLTTNGITHRRWCCLLANLNSFAYDYVARQKVGGLHLNFFIVEQLPTFPPEKYDEKCPWDKKQTLEKWISERVLKLTCTADDMRPLADAAAFKEGMHKWNDSERAQLRAELDAAYVLLFNFTRDEINDVLNGFNGVVKEDAAHGGPGQTRSAILNSFDALGGK